jgi:hypothetical protein
MKVATMRQQPIYQGIHRHFCQSQDILDALLVLREVNREVTGWGLLCGSGQ